MTALPFENASLPRARPAVSQTLPCPKCQKPLEEGPNFCPWCGEDLRGLSPHSATLSGPWAGVLIDGRYRLKEKLGEGGMGTVYKVEHVRMGKVLALKVLRPEVALDKQLKQRFQQEARVVSRLSHTNTIQVFDFGELEDGSLYIAMEYLHGRDLAWTLRTHGSMSQERAVSIGSQVLASLSEAHEQGIIHRDIKPANVMLIKRKDDEDLVKVLDFGIAKLVVDEQRKDITGVSDFLGTPAYMSPEQAQGEDLDARSDLYSVGALLFELVTGRGVFLGPNPMSIVTQHITDMPPRFSDAVPGKPISQSLEQLIRKALAKRPEDRFANADEMRKMLEKVRRDWGYTSGEYTPPPNDVPTSRMARREDFDRFERSLRTRRVLAPVVALAVLGVVGAGAFFEYKQQEARGGVPRVVEEEPNNVPAQANRNALGLPIQGMIGAPLSETQSDRDLFVFDLSAPTPLTVDLTAVRDMNLVIEVLQFDGNAKGPERKLQSLLLLDDAPTGEGEHVDGLLAQAGPVYLRIQERAYFTEPRRPPRETTHAPYRLLVTQSPTSTLPIEIEPNDTLQTATVVPIGKAMLGFTGAVVPYIPTHAEQRFSSPDFFVAEVPDPAPKSVAALILAPPGGGLTVVDASAFEFWEAKSKLSLEPGQAEPALPTPSMVSGRPGLIGLTRSSRGFAIRLQVSDGSVPSGSRYALAFVSDAPDGLASAVQLANWLVQQDRANESEDVLRLVEERFAQSTQIPQIRALLAARGQGPREQP